MNAKDKLCELPLGSWFRYPGHRGIYVLLDRGGAGLVASANVENHSKWVGQSICSAADSAVAFREMLVELVPVKEIA